jgi:hypothetical protein
LLGESGVWAAHCSLTVTTKQEENWDVAHVMNDEESNQLWLPFWFSLANQNQLVSWA